MRRWWVFCQPFFFSRAARWFGLFWRYGVGRSGSGLTNSFGSIKVERSKNENVLGETKLKQKRASFYAYLKGSKKST
ncbi:hypothetical protein QBC35DRAFT_495485 [Podospora australis]|uniref:Uncharacterized protein n=1 Tax=Podospora australis TaxID=1536484 RepID=A0AAN7AHF5_9PEZI|nr:hypothetical protein QBC35DRAFT_495485 [Podospora australis]